MGRSRGSRSGRSGRVAANTVAGICSTTDCVDPPLAKATLQGPGAEPTVVSAVKLTPSPLAVDGSDSTPSTASPSHAGTAVSTPTSHGTIMACGEGVTSTLDDEKEAEKMVNDLVTSSRDECPPSLQLATLAPLPSPPSRGPEPWALPDASATKATQQDGTPPAKTFGYRDLLRCRGRLAMQGSNLWNHIAIADATVESGGNLSENLPAAQALGLMWNVAGATTYPSPPVPQSPFHYGVTPTTSSRPFFMQPQIPSMSPPQMPPMHSPTAAFDNCGVDQLLAIAMPGPLAGLNNLQIEEQLRAAASQIDVYDD